MHLNSSSHPTWNKNWLLYTSKKKRKKSFKSNFAVYYSVTIAILPWTATVYKIIECLDSECLLNFDGFTLSAINNSHHKTCYRGYKPCLFSLWVIPSSLSYFHLTCVILFMFLLRMKAYHRIYPYFHNIFDSPFYVAILTVDSYMVRCILHYLHLAVVSMMLQNQLFTNT